MTILLYVLRQYLKYAAAALFISTIIFLMFDFIERSQRYFPKYEANSAVIFKYYILQIPNLIIQNIPIAALLASVITMVLLSRSNEITAMRAAGISPLRLSLPLVIGGTIMSIASLIIGETIAPKSALFLRYVENVEIEGGASSIMDDGTTWLRKDSIIYNFKHYETHTKTITDLKIETIGPAFRPIKTIMAKRSYYKNGIWNLSDVKIYRFHADGTRSLVETIDKTQLELPFLPQDLEKEQRRNVELSIKELRKQIHNGENSSLDTKKLRMDMQKKLAFSFAALVVSLVGLRFGYRSERNVETVRGVLLAIFIGLSYWLILTACQTLGKQDMLDPISAAWSANVIVLGICVGEFVWQIRHPV